MSDAIDEQATAVPHTTPLPDAPHAEDDTVTPEAVRREVRDFLRSHEERNRQFPRAALVGMLAGLAAVAFRWSLAAGDTLRNGLIAWAHRHPIWGWVLPMLVGAVGAGVAVRMVRRLAPETAGSGIPHVKAVLYRLHSLRWGRILPVKFLGGTLGIGGGLALGREGPTIQMGGAMGAGVAQLLKVTSRERQTLIAAGAGAGLAAAFNAPLAGLVFVLEEVQRDFSPTVFAVSLVAAVTADVVTRLLTGQLPVFHIATFPAPPLSALPAFLALGLLAGVLGVAFNRALLGSLNLFARLRHWPAGLPAVLVGASVGLVGWFAPSALGGGQPLVEQVLTGNTLLHLILVWFLLRFALTMFSYGCGAPGGIFAPLLVLGALLGLAVGKVTQSIAPGLILHPQAVAVVGMGAYFAAIVRAPLTGIVLIVEMTNNYPLMLPLLVACLSAYAVADLMGDRPIYEALLERDLLRSQATPELGETLLLELPLQPGSPFDGKQVRDLGLPPGCVLITVRRGVQESVPTADTRLQAGDWITAVIAAHAARAATMLREGCTAGHGQSTVAGG
ncbi:MAG: H(+)/Cl(-) exchange transporter ClcA [Armatimonadetes bacterium]|nr:H(+)/Cl(-) exchange transporter ClcA [Armatimonadota bacterium]